jgi:hypothetical protein
MKRANLPVNNTQTGSGVCFGAFCLSQQRLSISMSYGKLSVLMAWYNYMHNFSYMLYRSSLDNRTASCMRLSTEHVGWIMS